MTFEEKNPFPASFFCFFMNRIKQLNFSGGSMKHSLSRFVLLLSALVLLQFLVPVIVYAETTETAIEEPDNLYALSACLMDAESGRVLFSKNAQEKRANASTTKTMTLIVTLENANLDDLVTVSEYAARQPDVQLNINTGEQYFLRDLCYSLMLESHNDSAVAIAEHVGGSVENFAAMMNKKAVEIGCKDTHFVTPNGLDASDDGGEHGTTAEDLARILSYCILKSPKREEFLEITRTPSYSFHNQKTEDHQSVGGGNRSFSCNNHNAFLNMMEGALSGKTGFTGNAGYCYVGALRRDERTYVVALLGCEWPNNKTYKWSDTKKLMQYGIDYFEPGLVSERKASAGLPEKIIVRDAWTDDFSRRCEVEVETVEEAGEENCDKFLLRRDEDFTVEYTCEEEINAPVKKGTVVGTVEYKIGEEVIKREKIVCKNNVKKYDFPWGMERIFQRFFL